MKCTRKIKIPGVTGFFRWAWLERRQGAKDSLTQMRQVDEGYSTPWIERAYHCYFSQVNAAYLRAVKELEPAFVEVAQSHRELELIDTRQDTVTVSGLSEEISRQASARAAQCDADMRRRQTLILRLSELRANLETADEEIAHYIFRTEGVLRRHISNYWDGVLRKSGEAALPPFPTTGVKELPGQQAYQRRMSVANSTLAKVLDNEGKETA